MGDTTAVSVQTTDQSLQAGGKGRKGPGRKAGEATGLAGREAPPQPLASSDSAPSFSANPHFPCRPVLCHDDAPGRASDRNAEDNCTSDTPLLPVCAGDLVPGIGDAGRACRGHPRKRRFSWDGNQAVEYTAGSWCIFWSAFAFLV